MSSVQKFNFIISELMLYKVIILINLTDKRYYSRPLKYKNQNHGKFALYKIMDFSSF
jgi:hypothetical protein